MSPREASSPRIPLFSLGGTIASGSTAEEGASPKLAAEELLALLPQVAGAVDIEPINLRLVASSELVISDIVELSSQARTRAKAGAKAAVVSLGTDTLEEAAFILDLLWEREEPIVVTGAMRHGNMLSPDGAANLVAAFHVAMSEAARGLGALVVLNDEIHAARFVHKAHTSNVATFRSSPIGPIGWLTEGLPRIAVRPTERHHIRLHPGSPVASVVLIRWSQGDDGRVLDVVARLGFSGAVVEALGGGHLPSVAVPRIEKLAARMPVVLVSRTGSGELLRSTYEFPGSERDLLSRGLIAGGILDGLKARILLSLLVSAGAGLDVIRDAFDAVGIPGQGGFRFAAPTSPGA
jgi:L-asparaginase